MAKLKRIPPELPDGRRHLNLTIAERAAAAEHRQIEHAVALYLDVEQDRTLAQIAQEVGLENVQQLKRLTKRPEFQELYNETVVNLAHHPRLMALQNALPELLPTVYLTLRRLLGPGASDTASLGAAKLILETLNVKNQQQLEDGSALNNFLKQSGVNIEGDVVMNMNLPIPDEYKAAFARLMGKEDRDIIEGVSRTAGIPPAGSPLSRRSEQADPASEPLDGSEEID